MLINREDVPETPEVRTCQEHGEYQVRYTPISTNKLIYSGFCEDCLKRDKAKAEQESLEEQKKNIADRKYRRLLNSGVSKRLIKKTFNDYIATTKGQIKAKAVCESVATSLVKGDPTPSLILNGGVGTGKTALAACIVGEVIDSRTVRLKKAIDLVRELKETWKKDNLQTEKEIIKFYSELDLLIIDEIGMQFGSDTERLFIFDVIDGRYNENKPTIIITNLGMEAVTKTIGERTVDRLREDGGQMIRFDWESYRKN